MNKFKSFIIMVTLFLSIPVLRAEDDAEAVAAASRAYSKSDRLLNIEYQILKKLHNGQALEDLKNSQRSWVGSRNVMWGDPENDSDLPRGESLPEKLSNLTLVTLSRVEYLKAYTGDNVLPGLAGDYTDSQGGNFSITATGRPNIYSVTFEVVRGRGLSNGFEELSLSVHPGKGNQESGRIALENGCTVDFKRINHLIKVTEIGGCDHGAGAYYSGNYLKVMFKGVDE
ncbi:MAG: hypothetical protein R3A80_06045 [Bdellovibrionota bacterium]